jgi:hypothetical protein
MPCDRLIVLLVLGILALAAPLWAAQFIDIGPTLGLPETIGAAWGDYDGDGAPDLVLSVRSSGHYPTLLHNDGGLAFTDVSAEAGFPATPDEQDGVAWADYDNDGDLDLIIVCGGGYTKLYRNDGAAFTEVGTAAGLNVHAPEAGRGAAWCDYDGDDLLDVFICSSFGQASYLFRNRGDGTFEEVNAAVGMSGDAFPTDANTAIWADYDNDGAPDLLLTRWYAYPQLYHNRGDGTFEEVGAQAGFHVVTNSFGAAWGDYDNDGWLDCYIGSSDAGPDWLLHNNHDGTFTDVSASAGMAGDSNAANGVAWADYDNDGYLDLFVANWNYGSQAFLYHNNGDGTFTEVAGAEGMTGSTLASSACWADIDGDGRPDVFEGGYPDRSFLYHNVGPAGHWLRVRGLTTGTGDATNATQPTRDAIGARVEVNLDNDPSFPYLGRTLSRLIDGGSSMLSQNEPVAQFGLGEATEVAVRVLFPDGSVVTQISVAADQQVGVRDIAAAQNWFEDDDPAIQYAGPWQTVFVPDATAGHATYSDRKGASAHLTFTGTGFHWYVVEGPLMGKARVTVDGGSPETVDLYSASLTAAAISRAGLTPGNHTLRIEVLRQRRPASRGFFVDLDAVEAIP